MEMGNEVKYQIVSIFWISRAKQRTCRCPDNQIDGLFRYAQKEPQPKALDFISEPRLLILRKEIDKYKTGFLNRLLAKISFWNETSK